MLGIPQVFTARQVVSITGVPYSKLDFWTKSGLIRPSVSEADGSGSRRLYGRDDLVRIRVAWNLRQSGISGRALRKVMDYLRDQKVEGRFAIQSLGEEVLFRSGRGEVVSARRHPGQMYLNLTDDLSEAVAHVKQGVERLQNSDASLLPRKPPQQAHGSAIEKRKRRSGLPKTKS